MSKITAIHGGGDWSDASADYLVLPEGMDIHAERTAWQRWYKEEYLTSNVEYLTFPEWLLQRGARTTTADELTIYEEN